MASPLAWIMADIFLIIAYVVIMRKLRGREVVSSTRIINLRQPARNS
jgi:hypothetical protein